MLTGQDQVIAAADGISRLAAVKQVALNTAGSSCDIDVPFDVPPANTTIKADATWQYTKSFVEVPEGVINSCWNRIAMGWVLRLNLELKYDTHHLVDAIDSLSMPMHSRHAWQSQCLELQIKCMEDWLSMCGHCIMCASSLVSALPVAQVLHSWADWALPLGCHSGGWTLAALLLCWARVNPAVWASFSESILDLLLVQFLLLVFWTASARMTWVQKRG